MERIARNGLTWLVLWLSLPGLVLAETGPEDQAPALRVHAHPARHHMIFTDLDAGRSFEAVMRFDALADAFSQLVELKTWPEPQPLPVFLYARAADYRRAMNQDHPHVFAIYTGKELRAALDEELFSWESIWREVQQQACQQFIHRLLGRSGQPLPTWLSAGLAEYFGQGLWCGDGMVLGLIEPARRYTRGEQSYTQPSRLERIQQRIRAGQFQPLEQFLGLESEKWAEQNQAANFDQAWALVHYLLHARSGLHRRAFIAHLNDILAGKEPGASFAARFGTDQARLDQQYRQWWQEQGEALGRDRRDRAMMRTFLSVLARSQAAGETFDSADVFFAAARAGELKIFDKPGSKEYLPRELVNRALTRADALPGRTWKLTPNDAAGLVLEMPRADGAVFAARLDKNSDRPGAVGKVVVTVLPAPASQPAE
jgi:hypothetical protein